MKRREAHELKKRIEYLEQRAAWKQGEERIELLAAIKRLQRELEELKNG